MNSTTLNNFDKIFMFILIYLFLLFGAGFYFHESMVMIGHLFIIFILTTIIIFKKGFKFDFRYFISFIILPICLLTSNIFTNSNLKTLINSFLIIFEIFITTNIFNFEIFKQQYINCLLLISIFSIFGFIVLNFESQLINLFPTITNSNGIKGKFLFFSTLVDYSNGGSHRIQGIFWEPGVFQFFIFIGYMFLLYSNEHNKFLKLITLLLALFLTVSTTGIFVLILLVFLTFIKKYPKKIKTIILITIFLVLCFLIFIFPNLDGYLKYTLVTKIDAILNYEPGINSVASSRIDSIYYPFIFFIESPFFGIGNEGYNCIATIVGHNMFTFTPINLFAVNGIFYGIIIYAGFIGSIKNLSSINLEKIILFLILMMSISTESLTNDYILILFSFYGLKYLSNKIRFI